MCLLSCLFEDAIAGLSLLKTSEAALELILEYTKPGVPQALRLSAIRSLGTISTGQTSVNLERILERLAELSKEAFFLTQVGVVMALGQMETPKAIGILQALRPANTRWSSAANGRRGSAKSAEKCRFRSSCQATARRS